MTVVALPTEAISRGLHPAGAARIAARLEHRHWATLQALSEHTDPVQASWLLHALPGPTSARHIACLLRSLAADHLVDMVRPPTWRGPAMWRCTDRGRQVLALRQA